MEQFARRLRRELPDNVLDIRLFGSEARGEATPESDIDVLVVVQPDVNGPRWRPASSISPST